MRRLRTIAAAAALLLLVGCSGLRPDKAFVRAERAHYNSLAPIIRALADEDPTNDPDLRGSNSAALLEQLKDWDKALSDAEAAAQ